MACLSWLVELLSCFQIFWIYMYAIGWSWWLRIRPWWCDTWRSIGRWLKAKLLLNHLERGWGKHSFPCSEKVSHAMMYRRFNLFICLAEHLATKNHQRKLRFIVVSKLHSKKTPKETKGHCELWCPSYTLKIKKICLYSHIKMVEDEITNLW